jgi:uncharacterized membrane protein
MSKNGIALAVLLAEALLSALGVEFDASSVERAIEGVAVFIALCLAVYHQVAVRTDTKWLIFKK